METPFWKYDFRGVTTKLGETGKGEKCACPFLLYRKMFVK